MSCGEKRSIIWYVTKLQSKALIFPHFLIQENLCKSLFENPSLIATITNDRNFGVAQPVHKNEIVFCIGENGYTEIALSMYGTAE